MGIGAGGAAAQVETGHDAFVGGEEQRDSGGGEQAGARLTTSCLQFGKPVSRRRSSTSKYCLGWSACIHPMHQAARGSGVWPVSRGLRFAAAARLPGRGHLRWSVAGQKQDRAHREINEHQVINNPAAKATFLLLNLSTLPLSSLPRRSQ
jgi:hypothetical protein